MAEIMDDVVHLSQEIGPHPAGTEEEQQAALYLAEQLQKESGFTSVIEDFQCVTNPVIPTLVCFGIAFIAVIISIVVPVAAIPCFFIVAIAAALYLLEALNKPVISRFLRTGASQNVVAKYQPSSVGGIARRRKIILVANYDSGKVLKDEQLPIAGFLPILQKASSIALVVAAVLLLLRMSVFASDTGAVSSVLTMLLVICAVLFVVPLARAILQMVGPYSHSANNNAAGVAVLLDVARQVGNGLVSNEEALERGEKEGNQIHGEAAAREAGVIPEGASLEYDDNLSPQESLAAAKAAIAALTGKPVADKVPVTDISSRLVKGGGLEPVDEEAVSSVHFEVSETPQVRPEKSTRFRTMVPMNDEPDDIASNSPKAKVEEQIIQHQEELNAARASEEQLHEANAVSTVVDAQASAAHPAEEYATTQVQAAPMAESHSIASFERPAPMSVIDASSRGAVDKTPAWAKKAQAKARANKPEESQPHRVARSRYADTIAAHLMESATERQREFEAQRVTEANDSQIAESDNPELASRLAALRSEIESTEAPHISTSTQAVLDTMGSNEDRTAGQESTRLSSSSEEVDQKVAQSTQQDVLSDQTPQTAEGRNQQVSADTSEAVKTSSVPSGDTTNTSVQEPADSTQPMPVQAIAGQPVLPRQEKPQQATQDTRSEENVSVSDEAVLESSASSASLPDVSRETVVSSTERALENRQEGTPSETTNEALEQEETQNTKKPSLRSRMSRGASQSVRKATSAAPHAFASRLKSITSRKNTSAEEPVDVFDDGESISPEPMSNEVHERDLQEQQNSQAAESSETQNTPAKNTDSSTVAAKTNVPVSPNETAAISPIDVSRFMDKEKLEDEPFIEDDTSYDPNDPEVFYRDESFNVSAEDNQQLAAEETQRVSSERIQEAIEEASAHEPVVQPRSERPSVEEPQAASPIVGMESMLPQVPSPEEVEAQPHAAKRQVIVLPDVMAPHASSTEGAKQRAPMAESNESTKAGSKALLSNMLPRIGESGAMSAVSSEEKRDTFGLDLPSLGDTGTTNTAVSATGSFSTVGATGSFAPVGDELVADIDPEDRYVDDADDSAYDEDYTETGAFAGQGYVDMPKSRAGRLFGRFRKKKKNKQDEVSVNEWVDVDDTYDARSVGKARGDWSSFRQDDVEATTQVPRVDNDGFVDVDYHDTDFDNRRGWNGGAFSLSRLKKSEQTEEAAAQDGIHD